MQKYGAPAQLFGKTQKETKRENRKKPNELEQGRG